MQLAAKMTFDSPPRETPDERLLDRTRLRLPAALRGGEATLDLTIHDLSADGFFAEGACPDAVGRKVQVMLGGAMIHVATIVRQDGRHFAARFDAPLTGDELRRAIGASPVVWGDFGAPAAFARQVAPATRSAAQAASDRWPRSVRATLMIGMSLALWGLLLIAVR